MSPHAFSDLAPEVLMSVMRLLESPKDLFSLIRTSKNTYEIFCDSKFSILEAVLRNAVPPDIMPDAWAACEAAEMSKMWWKHVPSDRHEKPSPLSTLFHEKRQQLIASFSLRHTPARPLSSHSLYSLVKLWRITNDFLCDFQNRALISASNKFPQLQTGWDDPISPTERSRLLRAFFRFEIFRRLFPDIAMLGVDEPEDSRHDDFIKFAALFSPWEREEILSVHEYLVRFAKDTYRDLQEYFLHRLRKAGEVLKQEAKTKGVPFETEDLEEIEAWMDMAGPDIFQSGQFLTKRRFQYLVSRGLPFLHWLTLLDSNERIYLVEYWVAERCRTSLFELMYNTARWRPWSIELITQTISSDESFGWRWARQNGLVREVEDTCKRYVLREAGVFFWDAKRLIRRWWLPWAPVESVSRPHRSEDDNDGDWDDEPSMSELLRDIPVAKGFFSDGFITDSGKASTKAEALFKADEDIAKVIRERLRPFSQEEVEKLNIEY